VRERERERERDGRWGETEREGDRVRGRPSKPHQPPSCHSVLRA
jgi:hypothetical protein